MKKVIVLVCLAICGCTWFGETYHFRVDEGSATNYFRVEITGWTLLSTADYSAGLFDAEAVDAAFGEVSAEAARTTSASLISGSGKPSPNGTSIESLLGESIGGKRLVLMLTADPTAITNQINAFTSSQQTFEAFAGLELKEERVRLVRARERARAEEVRAAALSSRLSSAADHLNTASTPDAIDAALLAVTRALVEASNSPGGNATITSGTYVDDAARWRSERPNAFSSRGGQ